MNSISDYFFQLSIPAQRRKCVILSLPSVYYSAPRIFCGRSNDLEYRHTTIIITIYTLKTIIIYHIYNKNDNFHKNDSHMPKLMN